MWQLNCPGSYLNKNSSKGNYRREIDFTAPTSQLNRLQTMRTGLFSSETSVTFTPELFIQVYYFNQEWKAKSLECFHIFWNSPIKNKFWIISRCTYFYCEIVYDTLSLQRGAHNSFPNFVFFISVANSQH